MIKDKMKSLALKASQVVTCASVMAMSLPSVAFADDDKDGFLMQEIKIDPSNVDSTTIISRLLGIIAGIFIVVGLFRCGTAIFQILEAYSEDNSAAINKGVKQLAIGAAFIGAPTLMIFLFK